MKPTIKIRVVDYFEDHYFLNFLSKKYNIVLSDDPDYILCSVFGNEFLRYSCIKILFIGENIVPDFNLYDYALGFQEITYDDRYLRFPLAFIYPPLIQKAQDKHLNLHEEALLNRDFCSFVVTNPDCSLRVNFFDLLNEHKFVASAGKVRNNVGEIAPGGESKHEFIKKYKFNIAFENSSSPYYATEKLFNAFAAQTIPIYWGDPRIKEWVNPKAMINVSDFSSFQEAIEYILYVDSNPSLYLEMIHQKVFFVENMQDIFEKRLEAFFDNIFSQDLQKAKRRQSDFPNGYICRGGGKISKLLYSPFGRSYLMPLLPYYRKIKKILRR